MTGVAREKRTAYFISTTILPEGMKASCLAKCPQASTSLPYLYCRKIVHCYFFPLQIVALGMLIDKEKSNVYVKAELKLSFPGKTSEFPFKTKSSFSVNTYLREINICARNFQRVQRARLQILALKRCFVIPSSLIYANFHITV